MKSRNFLTIEERKVLEHKIRCNQKSKFYIRMHVVLLYDDGYSIKAIVQIHYIDEDTVRRYLKIYGDSGIGGLGNFKYKGKHSNLTEAQKKQLIEELKENTYLYSREVCEYVKKAFGVSYTANAMTKILKKFGFSYKKPKIIPGKANGKKQKEFLENSPNLNLIERLWKFFKEKVCSKYFEKYEEFKNAVYGFFNKIEDYKKNLERFITSKFRIMDS
jgi:transposase